MSIVLFLILIWMRHEFFMRYGRDIKLQDLQHSLVSPAKRYFLNYLQIILVWLGILWKNHQGMSRVWRLDPLKTHTTKAHCSIIYRSSLKWSFTVLPALTQVAWNMREVKSASIIYWFSNFIKHVFLLFKQEKIKSISIFLILLYTFCIYLIVNILITNEM